MEREGTEPAQRHICCSCNTYPQEGTFLKANWNSAPIQPLSKALCNLISLTGGFDKISSFDGRKCSVKVVGSFKISCLSVKNAVVSVAGDETLNEAVPVNCFTEEMKNSQLLKPEQTETLPLGFFLLKIKVCLCLASFNGENPLFWHRYCSTWKLSVLGSAFCAVFEWPQCIGCKTSGAWTSGSWSLLYHSINSIIPSKPRRLSKLPQRIFFQYITDTI